eukprot:349846-Chlamydomonas_euryale.AAC.2
MHTATHLGSPPLTRSFPRTMYPCCKPAFSLAGSSSAPPPWRDPPSAPLPLPRPPPPRWPAVPDDGAGVRLIAAPRGRPEPAGTAGAVGSGKALCTGFARASSPAAGWVAPPAPPPPPPPLPPPPLPPPPLMAKPCSFCETSATDASSGARHRGGGAAGGAGGTRAGCGAGCGTVAPSADVCSAS